MNPLQFTASGELTVLPSPSSSQNDFNFLVGKWNVQNRKLKTRLENCTEWIEFEAKGEMRRILNGIGNTDSFVTELGGTAFEGMTLRLFDPQTRLWSIYWADSVNGRLDRPVVGSFEESGLGYFYTRDQFNGKEIIMGFCWDARDASRPIWSQAFSVDSGKTWEWNWYMYMTPDQE